ncbi:MAG: hypothetical protein NZ942_00930 [Candidatus Aenigmarchaeota archaeon]|nr:hypothetical protein [Candidatus Aenigmarchaeota archaeon]
MEEKIVTINIRKDLLKAPVWNRKKVAMKILKEKVKKICKSKKLKVDNSISRKIFSSAKPLTKFRVKIVKVDEETSKVELMS